MSSGTNGRRRTAAWGLVLVALVFPTLVTLVYFVWLWDYPTRVQQAAYGAGKALQFALPVAWVWLIRRQRPVFRPPAQFEIPVGIAFGLSSVAAFSFIYFLWLRWALPASAVEAIRVKLHGLGVSGLPAYVVLALFYATVHSLLEEYYWRWFVSGQLQDLTGAHTAIGVSALGFTAHHVCVLAQYFGWGSWLTACGSLAVAGGGAFWAWMYHRFGTLWGAWLSHLLLDAGIFLVGYDLVM